MDQLFVVLLSYLKPLEEVDIHLPAHRAFLQKHYNSSHFIVSGPQIPREGGLILMRAQNREEAMQIMNEDPFTQNGVSSFQIIQFKAADFAEDFERVMK